jgi:hypothetical protein
MMTERFFRKIPLEESGVDVEQSYIKEKLTDIILENMNFSDVIYGERSGAGAMGLAGHALLYVFDGGMASYLTLHDDGEGYDLASKIIWGNKEMFDWCPGCMGNGVFIKKDAPITIDQKKECLVYEKDGEKYPIYCSARGIFQNISRRSSR